MVKEKKKQWGFLIGIIILGIVLMIGLVHVVVHDNKINIYEAELIYAEADLSDYESKIPQEPVLKVCYKDRDGIIKTASKPYTEWTDTEKFLFTASTVPKERMGIKIKNGKFGNAVGYKHGRFEIFID